ncbi:hypothetical protein D3C72_1065350 [compost metagenome]
MHRHVHRVVVVDGVVALGFAQAGQRFGVLVEHVVAHGQPAQGFPAVVGVERLLGALARGGHALLGFGRVFVLVDAVALVVVAPDLVAQPVFLDLAQVGAGGRGDEGAHALVAAAPARLLEPDALAHEEEQPRVHVQRGVDPVGRAADHLAALHGRGQGGGHGLGAGDALVVRQAGARELCQQLFAGGRIVVQRKVVLQRLVGPAAAAHQLGQPVGLVEGRGALQQQGAGGPHRGRERECPQGGDGAARGAGMGAFPAERGDRAGPARAAVLVGPVVPVVRFAEPGVGRLRAGGLPCGQAGQPFGAVGGAAGQVVGQGAVVALFLVAVLKAGGQRVVEPLVECGVIAGAQQRVDVAELPARGRRGNHGRCGGGRVGGHGRGSRVRPTRRGRE